MYRLFVRSYLSVVLVVALATLGGGLVLRNVLAEASGRQLAAVVHPPVQQLQQAVAQHPPGAAQQAAVAAVARSYGYPIRLAEVHTFLFSGTQKQTLSAGRNVLSMRSGVPFLYVPLTAPTGARDRSQSPRLVAALGPLPEVRIIGDARGAIWFVLQILALAGGVLLIIRPLRTRLASLRATTQRFGDGVLDERAAIAGDDVVAELAGSFNDMAARIQHLLEAQKALLGAVSHEFRTPLTRIRYALDLLALDADGDALTKLDQIHRDVDELDELVAELMTYVRLDPEAGALELVVADPSELLGQLVADAGLLDADAQVTLQCANLGQLPYDAKQLRRAVGNLLQNALRYGAGEVLVQALRDPPGQTHGWLTIAVHDNGDGVEPQHRQRLFEPFVVLNKARDPSDSGFGLGLAIVRRIAQAHQGSVEATESHLGGACFRLRLPAPAADEPSL